LKKTEMIHAAARDVLREYALRVKAFRPNARLYLLNVIIAGVAMGVFRLLFNFYVLSLGYDEALLGRLVTINNLTALIFALPSGYIADQMGRKTTLIAAGALNSLSVLGMVLWPGEGVLYTANVIFGLGQSLAAVTMAPFLMENSGEHERTYLFSFSSGLQMASASAGNWIGGYLPTWIGNWQAVQPTDSLAYAGAMGVVALMWLISLAPLSLLRTPRLALSERSFFAPIDYARQHPTMLGKLVLPMLITSLGAGLLMPFMNIFFRQVHHQPDPVIGALFAWGSLAMGIGLLIAPPLADRMGKIEVVVVTQALSVPFLVLLGFSPWFWLSAVAYYVRLALMNMSSPVYNTFVMEKVEPSARATVASLVSMAWNFGWVFSPMVSGWLQVNYGFGPVFMGTISLYSISIYLYWAFFLHGKERTVPTPMPGD
jgi:MFS family permease